jgi:hypothetical protein
VQVTLPVDSLNTTTGVPIELWALLNLNHATSPEDRLVHPDGKYVLAVGTNATPPPVSKDGTLAYRTEFYPGFESPLMAIPIELSPSEDRAGVHFQLRLVPAHRVSGVVTGPTGPLSNQLVRLVVDGEEDNGFGSEAATTMTGPDGTFALLNVPAGRYSLQVRTLAGILGAASPPVPSTEATLRTSSVKSWGEVAVMVTDSDVSDVHVDVLPSVALSGRVVLEGRPRVTAVDVTALRVGVLPADRTIGAALTQPLDKDGRFKFDGLAPGSYFVRVSAIPRGFALKSISGGGVDLLDRPAEIDDDTDVTIVFDDSPNELWGTVRDPRGAQAVGASIIMFPADAGAAGLNSNRARETRAATSGLYSIAGLPAGDYYVVAIDDAQAEGWQDARRADALRAFATRVTLREGERKFLDLRLQGAVRR